ncbi:hypothetical protein LJC18_01200 [Lachnospiraceae bacterium OttesenSCG-928-E19]|nr:hypothetical protein [Lachnospiraceae bacterium OttesenSCG-928-E19]
MIICIQRELSLSGKTFKFLYSFAFLVATICGANGVMAAQAPNPRSSNAVATARDGREVKRTATTVSDDVVSRSARRTTTVATPRVSGAIPTTAGVVASRSASRQPTVATGRSDATTARVATTPVVSTGRSATTPTSARSAVSQNNVNVSRAATARATAIYDDVSKIGGGYAECRDAYSTCMDQFCGKSNDTYRRCYCSEKITEFRNTEAALDEAKTMLLQFQDVNLDAIDKSAAEINAMYSATIGEAAIKNDTSAAQKTLAEIGDLLAGKKKVQASTTSVFSGLTLDFSAELDDIWGDNSSSNSIFGGFGSSVSDLSQYEGKTLYDAAHKQCMEMIKDQCSSNAVSTMAKSSYGILINQDCTTYEKKINTQRQAVQNTVREAENILRQARLEEYRNHNSADVNECIGQVKAAITADTACGTNYKRCLDYTGLYINSSTGEPIYSPQLFKLTEILNLNAAVSSGDILGTNPRFNNYLDEKKMFAERALDTCRDKADVVWAEFKRSALIEIAQAQDNAIESVKSTCVSTMAECYDTQSGAMASFDTTTAQAAGALNTMAARAMCTDKVSACAALFAGPNDPVCKFDNQGRLTTPQCGLTALLAFVQTVDNVKVAEGCEVGLRNFVETTCAPASGDTEHETPYGCRLMARGSDSDNYTPTNGAANTVRTLLQQFAYNNCIDPSIQKPASYDAWNDTTVKAMIDNTQRQILNDIEFTLYDECVESEGLWVGPNDVSASDLPQASFYTRAFGGITPNLASKTNNDRAGTSWGYCIQDTVKNSCEAQDEMTGGLGYAVYNPSSNTCTLKEEWYKSKCESMGGSYEGGVCYV